MLREATATEPSLRAWNPPLAAWVLLLVTAIPWGATEQVGGAVAAAKVAGFAVAVGLAFLHRRRPTPLGLPAWLLIGYAVVAGLGAFLAEEAVVESLTRSARFAATVAAAVWLVGRLGLVLALRVVAAVASAMCAVAVLGWLAGFGNLVAERLNGLLPPLSPNSLGAVAAIGLVLVATWWLRAEITWKAALWQAPALAAGLLLTQSRTAALATGLALLMALVTGRAGRPLAAIYVAGFAVLVGVMAGINPLSGSRYEWDSTFSGRTTGWEYVTDLRREAASWWLGDGLARKYVPDRSVFVGFRPVDGSWHSAYLQAGVLGLTLLVAAVLLILWRTATTPDRRSFLPLLVFLVASATLESSLNDVTFQLVVLAALAAPLMLPEAAAPEREAPVRAETTVTAGPLEGVAAMKWAAVTAVAAAAGSVVLLRLFY